MKRTLLGVVAVLVLAVAAVILRRGAESPAPADSGAGDFEQFKNDSLGVGFLLPNTPGWSFQYAPAVPGGGLAMAVNPEHNASVRLYVHPRVGASGLDQIVQQRRRQLAGLFQVDDLDQVIERVLLEGRQEFQGYPAWQYQALTEPVDVAGEAPQRVMFMLLTLERPDDVIEIVGILPHAARLQPEEQEALEALAQEVTFVIQSTQVR